MKTQDYQTGIQVKASADAAFEAIRNIAGWWTKDVEGNTQKANESFTVHFGKTNMTMKITESIPGKKVVWLVTDSFKHWTKHNHHEWNGTEIHFDISEKNGLTEVRFTHVGLIPGLECYSACADAWGDYIGGSLKKLLEKK